MAQTPAPICRAQPGRVGPYLMLGLCLLIVVTGILALGGEEQQGPVAGLLNYAQGKSGP